MSSSVFEREICEIDKNTYFFINFVVFVGRASGNLKIDKNTYFCRFQRSPFQKRNCSYKKLDFRTPSRALYEMATFGRRPGQHPQTPPLPCGCRIRLGVGTRGVCAWVAKPERQFYRGPCTFCEGASRKFQGMRAARAYHMRTTCRPRVDRVHTTCIPRAYPVHTAYIQHAHHVHTTCIPRGKHVYTTCKPRAYHVHTTSVPRSYHAHTTCIPRVYCMHTKHIPRAYRRSYTLHTRYTPHAHPMHTPCTPHAHHMHTTRAPHAHHMPTT